MKRRDMETTVGRPADVCEQDGEDVELSDAESLDVKWARLLFLASEVVESGLADGFGNEVVDEDVMIELRAEVKRYAPGGDA